MAETNANIEAADHLREHADHAGHDGPSHRRIETIEIIEAVVLAMVVVVTAWSGYQAARWEGDSGLSYETASEDRALSQHASLQSGQQILYDTVSFNSWLDAYTAGNKQVAAIYLRRFSPNLRRAFDAWIKLDPFHNPAAPPGPRFMPQYKDPLQAKADAYDRKALATFDAGVVQRDRSEDYVRITVVLAAVLFLIAVGQRFKIRGVRVAVTAVAGVFLAYALIVVLLYPRS